VSTSTVSFIAAGTCTINANQAGTANYNAATQAQQTFAVAKADQAITFTSTAPPGATVGGSTYTLTATGGGSGNPVTFTSATTPVCTVSTLTVTFLAAGTCTINGDQAGNTNYNAATQAQQSFTVKANQTITFTSTAPTTATVGGSTYTAAATASSGLTVAFTSATTPICTVSGSTVSFIATGTCTINANQAGNSNYIAATQVQQTFTVSANGTTLSITSLTANSGHTVTAGGTAAYGTTGDSQTITVVVCTTNTFPCTGITKASLTPSVSQTNGAWSVTTTNIGNGVTVFVRATQTRTAGDLTSNVGGPVTA
jgi:hypothetical protein